MKLLKDIYKNTGILHHAYLIQAIPDVIREELFSFFDKDVNHATHANPDFSHSIFETLTIDEARKIREMQAMKSFDGSRKIFVIETRSITHEAQNALLKAFEEPTPGTHFFVIIPEIAVILPTLRSRMFLISSDHEESSTKRKAQDFLKLSIPERLKVVGEISEEKNKGEAMALIDGLLETLKKEASPSILKDLLQAKSYLGDRSPSLKLILEYTALIV